jgi:hypothetical protein
MLPLTPETVVGKNSVIIGGEQQVGEELMGKEPLIIGGKKHNKTYKKKRHGNKSLTAWVKFVKKVAREEKLPYRDAMMRAKVRKDKGEKWMSGGNETEITGEEGSESIQGSAVTVGGRRRRSRRNKSKRRGSRRGSKRRR